MIQSFSLSNFGPIAGLTCDNVGKINLVIGPNRSGKTVLLKALYTAIKTIEASHRGKDIRKDNEVLFDKLYWTYQLDLLGDLVRNGSKSLHFSLRSKDGYEFSYSFGSSTERLVKDVRNTFPPTSVDSIFIPAKEILSLQDIILTTREVEHSFGFDETYYDLAKALRKPTRQGRNYVEFSTSRDLFAKALGGYAVFDPTSKTWFFKEGSKTYSINAVSEGTKKMSIFDTLLGNHYLRKGATVFIDEPESALHPALVSRFMDIIELLTHAGLQFFISTHSYFVIKKLYLIANQKNLSIPVISFTDTTVDINDMRDGMPDNAIVDESLRLYQEEIML